MASPNSKTPLPELDHKGFSRNQKTGWLLYLDRLTAWLWQDNDGAARWTLILDDVLRRASVREGLTGKRLGTPPSYPKEKGNHQCTRRVMVRALSHAL